MFDATEPDPTADVPAEVLDAVDDLTDRETVALVRLVVVGPAAAQDAVTYSLRPAHDPDAWDEWTKYADPDGYRAYVEALETVVDTAVVMAEAASDAGWRRLLGGPV